MVLGWLIEFYTVFFAVIGIILYFIGRKQSHKDNLQIRDEIRTDIIATVNAQTQGGQVTISNNNEIVSQEIKKSINEFSKIPERVDMKLIRELKKGSFQYLKTDKTKYKIGDQVTILGRVRIVKANAPVVVIIKDSTDYLITIGQTIVNKNRTFKFTLLLDDLYIRPWRNYTVVAKYGSNITGLTGFDIHLQ